MTIQFQIIDWYSYDEDVETNLDDDDMSVGNGSNLEYIINVFGKTDNGESISCKITGFKPFYYIKVSSDFNKRQYNEMIKMIEESYALKEFRDNENQSTALYKKDIKIVKKKDIMGFRNGKEYNYLRLVFNSQKALNKSKYIFKKNITIFGKNTKFLLYESNFEPFLRYCHIQELKTVGWVKIDEYEKINESSTALNIQVNYDNVIPVEKNEIANFLQMSWDIECYSYNYAFPDPEDNRNEIFQIGSVFKYYKNESIEMKHLLTLKKINNTSNGNLIIEECKNERELILKWVKLVNKMDPDIMYTYNGDTFDCKYLIKRSEIYNIQSNVLQALSRLKNIPSIMKKEIFESSAYGFSEYYRFYIPGRLNYDLLVHYRRGLKKYSSYKLNDISNEVLKESKHDVSAKDIFKSYEKGDPNELNKIGLYCLQDCELLQKLVDKQKILLSIIQLANVTYVPISYLLTRGQSIKVFSQILKKARQMNFLVPHINFNADIYPVMIKLKENHDFDTSDLCIDTHINIILNTKNKWGKNEETSLTIKSITDENTLICVCNTEILSPLYNLKIRNTNSIIQKLMPIDEDKNESFTGATVLTAVQGIFEENICVLDFASLYPTCIISRNLCYSTIVIDNNERYLDLPDTKYERIEWDDSIEYKPNHTCEGIGKTGLSKDKICGKQAYYEEESKYFCRIHDPSKKTRSKDEKFQKKSVHYNYIIVQPNDDGTNKGVIPSLLEDLYNERKKVKKLIKEAYAKKDYELADIYDNLQLSIKISLNSCYGFISMKVGNLVRKELGALTTYIGRSLIKETKDYAENEFVEYLRENKILTIPMKISTIKATEKEKENILKTCKIKK
jgi:DNA polymerase elongation subunit (family B)